MRVLRQTQMVIAGSFVLALFASTPIAAQTAPVFAQCAACHSIKAGEQRLGPTMNKVVGRVKASVAGYNYSPALKMQKGKWDDASLSVYLANPRTAVPGTKMLFSGVTDARKRNEVIAYLKTLK